MNRSQAMKEAARLFGKGGAVRDNGKAGASTPERRATAKAALKALRASIPKDRKPTPEERAELDRLFADAVRIRYTVGEIQGACGFAWFAVRGQGDTWDEAFAKVEPLYRKLAA